MTEEILISDMLNHYSLKITEISDLLTDVLSEIKDTGNTIEDGWRGMAANAFAEKLLETHSHLDKCVENISILAQLFEAAKNTALEDEAAKAKEAVAAGIENEQ